MELYIHTPNTSSWRGAQLKHREKFTLPLPLPGTNLHFTFLCYDVFLHFKYNNPDTRNTQETEECIIVSKHQEGKMDTVLLTCAAACHSKCYIDPPAFCTPNPSTSYDRPQVT